MNVVVHFAHNYTLIIGQIFINEKVKTSYQMKSIIILMQKAH